MNTNPWFLERMAEHETDRIRREMKELRLEKEVLQAGRKVEGRTKPLLYRPGPILGIVPAFARSLVALATRFPAAPPKSKSDQQPCN